MENGTVGSHSESSTQPTARAKLIDENGDPTQEYVVIITQIFTRFDRDQDGILSLREFNCMLHASGEEPTDKHTYGGLLTVFEDDGDDAKTRLAGRGVSLKGFIQMSVLSTVEDPEGERAQLQKLGFDLPRDVFPDPPTPLEEDSDAAGDGKSGGDDVDHMLEIINKIAARAKEEEQEKNN